jgi:hypothetical protein
MLVVDRDKDTPIPFVLVRLESPDLSVVDDTDMYGVADFNIPEGKYQIKIRHNNYRPYTEKMYLTRNHILEIRLHRAY